MALSSTMRTCALRARLCGEDMNELCILDSTGVGEAIAAADAAASAALGDSGVAAIVCRMLSNSVSGVTGCDENDNKLNQDKHKHLHHADDIHGLQLVARLDRLQHERQRNQFE